MHEGTFLHKSKKKLIIKNLINKLKNKLIKNKKEEKKLPTESKGQQRK